MYSLVWQLKKDLSLRRNVCSKTTSDNDNEFYELEPRNIDEVCTLLIIRNGNYRKRDVANTYK